MVSFISVCISLGICYFSGAQGCDFDIYCYFQYLISTFLVYGVSRKSLIVPVYHYPNIVITKKLATLLLNVMMIMEKICQSLYLTNKVVFKHLISFILSQ